MWDVLLTGFSGGAIAWGQFVVGAAIGIAGLLQGDKAARDAKKNLAARLARRKEQLKVALAENEKVFGELGVAQRKHTSQRIRGLADASRGTLTANTMYGGGRGLFAEQASGMRLAAKEKAKSILAIRAAYESDVDTSAVDAAKIGQANALLGLAGTIATGDYGTEAPPATGAKPPATGTQPPVTEAAPPPVVDSGDPLSVSNKPVTVDPLTAANSTKVKPTVGNLERSEAVESAGFESTESPASLAKRKRTAAAKYRKSKVSSMRKARTKAKPMKGATKTENGVKYTYDGTNWVKNPTL